MAEKKEKRPLKEGYQPQPSAETGEPGKAPTASPKDITKPEKDSGKE